MVSGESSAEEWRVGAAQALRVIDRGVLEVDTVRAIVAIARRLESDDGVPQDIEWAIDRGEIALLQARPMVALPDVVERTAPPGAWVRTFRMAPRPASCAAARRSFILPTPWKTRATGARSSVVTAS